MEYTQNSEAVLLVNSYQRKLMVFYWSLSDRKSRHISRTLLSTVADRNNSGVRMDSICLLISKFSILFTSPLVTVPNTSVIIGIIVNIMFHSFFSSLARSRYLSLSLSLSLCFLSVLSCFQPERQSQVFGRFCFLLTITLSDCLAKITWFVYISKSHLILFL